LGVRGIRLVSRKIRKLDPRKEHHNKLLLGHIVRMQEEIGTGGAGFRFIYASFLQEASALLNKPKLAKIADELTEVGDEWRRFALHAAKMCKDRMPMDYGLLADQLLDCAAREKRIYKQLRAEMKSTPTRILATIHQKKIRRFIAGGVSSKPLRFKTVMKCFARNGQGNARIALSYRIGGLMLHAARTT